MQTLRKDRDLVLAKRISKVVLVLTACGLIGVGIVHKSMISIPQVVPKTIEITFDQIVEAKEEPVPEPEVVPEPEPVVEPPIEEPIEEKVLLAEDSEEKVEIPPEVKEPEPKPESQPIPEPPKPIPKPQKKPVVKPKPKVKPPVEKKAAPKVQEAVKASPPPTPPSDNTAVTKPKISSLLVGLVERYKRYPKAARRAGMEGLVTVEFTISPKGRVTGAKVVKPSEKTPLDKAAADLAQRLVGTEFNIENPGMHIRVPIRYQLTEE